MKKILFAIAIVFTMSFCSLAQKTDNFWGDDSYNRVDDDLPWLSTITVGHILTDLDANEPAPLGDGLLILTVLGAGYFLRKKKIKNNI
jgi:hypothetical protein